MRRESRALICRPQAFLRHRPSFIDARAFLRHAAATPVRENSVLAAAVNTRLLTGLYLHTTPRASSRHAPAAARRLSHAVAPSYRPARRTALSQLALSALANMSTRAGPFDMALLLAALTAQSSLADQCLRSEPAA